MSDLLDRVRQETADRLNELAPALEEYERLTAAGAALDRLRESEADVGPPVAPMGNGARPVRKPGRPSVSKTRTRKGTSRTPAVVPELGAPAAAVDEGHHGRKSRRGKRRGKAPNTRAIQAVALITERPGITIPELAAEMKVNRTGMYRILPGPEMERKIRREGNGWFAVGHASSG